MLLISILGVLMAVGLLLEVLNFVARDFLCGGRRVDALRAAIQATQKDLAQADNKMNDVKADLRKALNDLDRVKSDFQSTEKEIARKQKIDPVLVYLVGPEIGSGTRFRAPLTKVLAAENADPNQKLMWSKEAFVEIWVNSEDRARQLAWDEFPAKQGYSIGAFVRTGDADVVGKAA